MTRNKPAEIKRKLLKLQFEALRNKYEGFDDDRRVFCNTYDMVMESLDVMDTIDNNFIWVAFNHSYDEEMEFLKEIMERFENR